QDDYSMAETGTNSGGDFNETVSGSDNYTLDESGNPADQTFSRTITGSGTYNRQDSGPGATLPSDSGSISYTTQETANARTGDLPQTETGSDRYRLLEKFINVANTGSGNTPGNMNFYAFGVPFVDPTDIPAGTRIGVNMRARPGTIQLAEGELQLPPGYVLVP